MHHGIRWEWQRERHYRTTFLRLAGERGALVLTLASLPFQPTKVYFSDALMRKIERFPEPFDLPLTNVIQAVPSIVERFLDEFGGVDYDQTLLLAPAKLSVQTQSGPLVRFPIVIGWWRSHASIVQSAELPLDEAYYADRILLITELNHACRDEE